MLLGFWAVTATIRVGARSAIHKASRQVKVSRKFTFLENEPKEIEVDIPTRLQLEGEPGNNTNQIFQRISSLTIIFSSISIEGDTSVRRLMSSLRLIDSEVGAACTG
jgi:hypothetical protein